MHSALVALVILAQPSGAPGPAQGLPRITLEEAVRRSLAKNVATLVSVSEIRRAEGLLSEARSGSLPTLVGNGTYTRLDADRTFPGSTTPFLRADQLNLNAVVTVPLLVPSRWAQWSHGADNLDVAKASDADVRRQTAITAARAYLAIVAQKRQLDVTIRARDTAREHYVYSRTRREGGVGNRVDEARAEQELASDEAQVHGALNNLFRTQEALGTITGDDTALDAAEDPVFAAPPSAADAIRDAEQRREDVRCSGPFSLSTKRRRPPPRRGPAGRRSCSYRSTSTTAGLEPDKQKSVTRRPWKHTLNSMGSSARRARR